MLKKNEKYAASDDDAFKSIENKFKMKK
jgi:hypothetical protein